MAELAALGAAASALELFVFATKIFKRYKDFVDTGHRVPKNLQGLANQLPYLRESLRRHAEEEQAALSAGDTAASAFILQECQSYLTKLDAFISELIPGASDSRVEKIKKAIKSVRKDDEMKQIQADLHHQITVLSYGSSVECMSRLATHRCIGAVPPSVLPPILNAPLRQTYGFPTTKVPKFIGRHNLINNVAQQLMASSKERTVVVLQGMGGQGKTQAALEVCSRDDIRLYFKPILWINASTEDSTAQALEHFAVQMAQKGSGFENAQAKIDFVKERLEDHNRPSLMVFDNYDDLATRRGDIKCLFPDDVRHAVLITSRHEDSVNLGQGVSVETMAKDEAIALLFHRSHLKESENDKAEAEEIVSQLGYLPLAIAQAGAYIHMKKIPLKDFVNHYSQRKGAVLRQTPEIWEYGLSVFTTWEMSMENVSNDAQFRAQVDGMLLFCAILHHDVINEEFLSHLLANVNDHLPPWTEPFATNHAWDSSKFQDIIARLGRLSLLQILKYKSGHYEFSLHPLVSDWLKLRIKPLQLCQSIESVMRIIALFIESKKGRQMRFEVRREVRTYVWSCLENLRDLESHVDSEHINSDTLLESKWSFVNFMFSDGQLSNGTLLLEKVVAVRSSKFGDTHYKTIAASKQLSKAYISLRRYEEAERLIKQRSNVSSEALSTALADCYSAQARYREAKDLYEELLPRLKTERGPGDPLTTNCMNKLADNYVKSAESEVQDDDCGYAFSDECRRAEELWLAVVDLTNANPVVSSPEPYDESIETNLAETYASLGALYHDRGRCASDRKDASAADEFAKSREWKSKALFAFEALYGPDHSRVLTASHNLAVGMNLENDFTSSEAFYRRTLDGYEQFYGPDHEITVNLCHCYGHVLVSQSKFLEGVTFHTRSYMGLEDLHGPGHDGTRSSFDCLVALYRSIDNLLEVEKLQRRALEKRTEALGRTNRITIDTAYDLATLYIDEQRWVDAEKTFQLVIDAYAEAEHQPHPFNNNDPNTPPWKDEKMLEALNRLAAVKFYQGEYDRSKFMFLRLLNWRTELDEGEHWSVPTLDVATNLTVCLERMGEEEKLMAEQIHEKFNEGYLRVEERAAGEANGDEKGESGGEKRVEVREGEQGNGEKIMKKDEIEEEELEKGMADLAVNEAQ